jgi:hypothetical protein
MATVAFDALKFIDQLEKAGYSEHQAKETARAYQAAHEGMDLATKADIVLLESRLETKIALAIEKSQNKLIFWMGGIVTVGVSVILWFIENHSKI